MITLESNKWLMKKYCLNEEQLLKIMHACIKAFLSEEELREFIYEFYQKEEMKLNKRYQKVVQRQNLLLLLSSGKSL